jgi:hypothetical protein
LKRLHNSYSSFHRTFLEHRDGLTSLEWSDFLAKLVGYYHCLCLLSSHAGIGQTMQLLCGFQSIHRNKSPACGGKNFAKEFGEI